MVFTADHFNSPEGIQKMQDAGTLTKGRADDLRNLVMQETDCLLHEAGAPPIHTPLEVLMKFPQHVKDRMYIVHTSNLPADCDLRVAPTGTDGTIRLDELNQNSVAAKMRKMSRDNNFQQSDLMLEVNKWDRSEYSSSVSGSLNLDAELSLDNIGEDEETGPEAVGKRATAFEKKKRNNSFEKKSRAGSLLPLSSSGSREIPLVSLRPASSTDAWFILNLLSSVPFLADLNYSSTMEVLEKAKVDTFGEDDIVVPANLRQDVLCVVWEGTCMEREQSSQTTLSRAGSKKSRPERQRRVSSYQLNQGKHTPLTAREASANNPGAVWFAGDWTGPRALQPEERLSGESMLSSTHDIVAMSAEGVKVITIEFPCLHSILQRGSDSYGQYLARIERCAHSAGSNDGLNINEIININSRLRKLTAVQKRHLESIAKGPLVFKPGERLWREGENVDKAFIVVSGTCLFVPGRRKGGAISVVPSNERDSLESFSDELHDDFDTVEGSVSLSDRMYGDAQKAVQQLNSNVRGKKGDVAASENENRVKWLASAKMDESFDDVKILDQNLRKRANGITNSITLPSSIRSSGSADYISNAMRNLDHSYDSNDSGGDSAHDIDASEVGSLEMSTEYNFANKVLGRLYNRQEFNIGLVFSRGHFLGDISKMVAGLLSKEDDDGSNRPGSGGTQYTLRDNSATSLGTKADDHREAVHSTSIAAGEDGCEAYLFPKECFIPFLDLYPGLLLSLLGTHAVV